MRQLWSDRGTTGAVALSVENGDAPLLNWRGVGARDFPLRTKGWKLDGAEVDKLITKKLSCGDCPAPCKGIVAVKSRGLSDVRRPDYETIVGFGAAILNEDLELVTACHDACNRYGMDAVSSSATLAWVCELVERGIVTAADLDGIDMRWGNGEAALALTIKMGAGDGCGAVAAQRRQARRRAPRPRQRAVRRPRRRPGARVPRPALHLAHGRDLHQRSDPRPPHRRYRELERDVQHEVPAARGRRLPRKPWWPGRAPRARDARRRSSPTLSRR